MKITRNNYELFFLDYLEGNLDENLVDDFLEFLQQNTDLKEELAMMDTAPIEPDSTLFANKRKLYKEKYDAEETFNHAAIGLIEGDLSEKEKAEFDAYLLKYPEKQKEVQRFQQTKLQPDPTIVFGKKNKLYRQPGGKIILMWSSRVAAVLVLALGVYALFNQVDFSANTNQLAVVETQEGSESNKPAERNDIEPIQEITIPAAHLEESKSPAIQNLHRAAADENRQEMKEKTEVDRQPAEIPPRLNSRNVSWPESQPPQVTLAAMTITMPENYEVGEDERFFADVVKEKTGVDNLSFNKIKRAGLNLISSISKENFDYETNTEGEITALKYDSRLLAFSIPTGND